MVVECPQGRKIAERHGGTVVADGVPNIGATFTVAIPVQPPTQATYDRRDVDHDGPCPRQDAATVPA